MNVRLKTAIADGARALIDSPAYNAQSDASVQELIRVLGRLDDAPPLNQEHTARLQARQTFTRVLRNGTGALTSAERRASAERARILNIAEGTTAAGGFLVPALVMPDLIARLKFFSAVASAANVIETDGGAPVGWPTTDDTGNPGALLVENAAASASDFVFGTATLGAYKFASGIIPVSLEILQDSAVDVADMMLNLLAIRIGRAQNTYFTTGTGTGQPQGAVTGASLGFQLPTGNTTGLNFAGLVQLYESIDPAYRASPNCAFMMNDSTLLAVKLILDGANRPLWLPDLLAPSDGSPRQGTLLGKPIFVNNDMPAMAANAKCVLFGDFSQYTIRQVRGAAVIQLDDSAYASKGQAAFIAFGRADGRVTSANTAALKYLQNSAT